ncbi:MAG TPA: cytochrome c-type biogenesis protein CcmH [Anaerolineales bacterium]|nr:cytochrome c-type biogenesis protein CcmH [Anaerolineales bacterium]
MLKKILFCLILLALAAPLARTADAQDATPVCVGAGCVHDDDVNRVAKKLFCPVCENVPLDVCPTQACIQWRATIREKLEAGWSEQQILDYFAQQYGERVLAQPSTRGINILVWVIPPVAVLGGAVAVWYFLRQMTRARPAPPGAPEGGPEPAEAGPSPAAADKYAAQLEQELERRR